MYDWLVRHLGPGLAAWALVLWYLALVLAVWWCSFEPEAVFPYRF